MEFMEDIAMYRDRLPSLAGRLLSEAHDGLARIRSDLADAPEMCLDRRREDPVWKASQAEDVQSRRDVIPMSVAPEA